jgi:D-alanyl-D-alanine carboxypeptidase
LNNRPPILKITKGEEVSSFGSISFRIKELWNKNIFIININPIFGGGKTGFIRASKETALFIFRFNTQKEEERDIVIILLGSENSKADIQKVYQWLQ